MIEESIVAIDDTDYDALIERLEQELCDARMARAAQHQRERMYGTLSPKDLLRTVETALNLAKRAEA